MSYIQYNLTNDETRELEQHLKDVQANVETDINKYLRTEGANEIIKNIIGFMPVSVRKKKHAKNTKSSVVRASNKVNLGLTIRTGKKFGYLVFPNEGRGYRQNHAQRFFEGGLDSSRDKLFNDVLEIIDSNL